MATIRFRRGNTDPTAAIQPTGLTMGEPVFNKELNTFWIGGSGPDGFTAIWVGAEIENTLSLESASPYKLATQYAIVNQIKTIVGASAGVQTIEGLSGQIDLVFGTGISGSTSPGVITLQNTGVTRLGLSGDWRTRGVTNFGGAATGGVTLGSEVWAGNATPAINSAQLSSGKFGAITNSTVLTGKSPMEILELMLIDYLTPTLSNLSMGFVNASATNSTATNLAFGMTADSNGTSLVSWSYSNPTNIASGGATLSSSTSGLVSGSNGTLLTPASIPSATGTDGAQNISFTPAAHYVGITVASTTATSSVTFTLTAKPTQGSNITTSKTYRWYPRIYHGWTTDPGLMYPPDSWKRNNNLATGLTTGALMGTLSMTVNDPDGGYSWTMPNTPGDGNTPNYVYFWIHSHWLPGVIKAAAEGGNDFAIDTDLAGTLVTGLTIDNGYTATYRRYRSSELLTAATIALRDA